MVGFSYETIKYLLGGSFRGSYYTLNDNIINGRIRGVAGVVGCNNCRTAQDTAHMAMIKELIKNDVIVLSTGCAAMACGKGGSAHPGSGQQVLRPGSGGGLRDGGHPAGAAHGGLRGQLPHPHGGHGLVKDGGLGDDISDLPAAGAAPEWMSEKAIAIGQYFVASGVYTVFGVTWPTIGSEILTDYLFKGHRRDLRRQVGLRGRPHGHGQAA